MVRTKKLVTASLLLAIPLFVFMGYLVERANLIEKLFRSLHLASARVPGSLAVATLVTCAVFATATGIVGAAVTVLAWLYAFVALTLGTVVFVAYEDRFAERLKNREGLGQPLTAGVGEEKNAERSQLQNQLHNRIDRGLLGSGSGVLHDRLKSQRRGRRLCLAPNTKSGPPRRPHRSTNRAGIPTRGPAA